MTEEKTLTQEDYDKFYDGLFKSLEDSCSVMQINVAAKLLKENSLKSQIMTEEIKELTMQHRFSQYIIEMNYKLKDLNYHIDWLTAEYKTNNLRAIFMDVEHLKESLNDCSDIIIGINHFLSVNADNNSK